MRVAILGGSFDPIHKGHLQIAKTALKKLDYDEVWFMPTLSSPLKSKQNASFHDRCEMIKRSIQPYRHMHLCTLEGEWSDQSFTIRTVKELIRRYPNHSFCWLIGDDQAQYFAKWKDSETLKHLIPFYVFARQGRSYLCDPYLKQISMKLIDVSSTQIRSGKALYMVDDVVMDYIGKHGLYLEDMIASCMSEKRFIHSQSVATLCAQLAHAHHLDERVAYIMGIMHDVCKEMPLANVKIWMQYHCPQYLEEAPTIWHGYIGADLARKKYHIYDKRICEAIFHHVKGRNKTDYDRILYIADKLDPSRGYDSTNEISISMKNLKKGFAIVKKQQEAYLKKEGTI